jgi:sugar-specific transcriptional regulator TrmB
MNNQDEKILIEAGLSEEQALVYSSLLEKGPMKAGLISSWTGLKRGLIYKVLDQLENMGLASKKGGEGTVAIFSPSHPQKLRDIMEQKEKALSLAKETVLLSLGSLSSKFNLQTGKPSVQFFEGKEAIERITSDYPKKDIEIRQWIDISEAMKIMGADTVRYLEERIKKGISKRMIISLTEENKNYVKKESKLTSFKFKDKDIPTAIQVYDDIVAMLTLTQDKNIGLIIEDKEIAETLKNIFDYNWQKAEKID